MIRILTQEPKNILAFLMGYQIVCIILPKIRFVRPVLLCSEIGSRTASIDIPLSDKSKGAFFKKLYSLI